jgi:hypothetical protein
MMVLMGLMLNAVALNSVIGGSRSREGASGEELSVMAADAEGGDGMWTLFWLWDLGGSGLGNMRMSLDLDEICTINPEVR